MPLRDKQKQKEYNAKYRRENKEKVKQIQADYYAKHRDRRIKSAIEWTKNNPEKFLETRNKYRVSNEGRFTSIKSAAKVRNIQFDLTREQVFEIINKPCFYCNETDRKGIDRIDSDVGYVIGNCVSCCCTCNLMKQSHSQQDFINQCKKIAQHHT